MEMILRLALALALAGVVTTVVALHQRAKAIHGVGSKRLQDLRVVRVLNVTDTEIAVLGNFVSDPKKKAAVVVVQAAALDPSGLQQLLQGLSLHEILVNDVYSTFRGDVSRDVPPYKVNVIYPATDKHVRKHMDQRFHMVVETKEAYHMITKPYIDNIPRESIEWVYNILDRKTESERIIVENLHPKTGFVLLPDFKWSDTSNLESLYCLAIVNDRSLRSIRDLNGSHLKLLRNIRNESLMALEEKYGAEVSSLRVYFHYQPTYYHLHVHFSDVKMLNGTITGKAVLLEDVIYNLSLSSDYYKNATLSYVLGEVQHKPLVELFREKRIL